MDSILKNLNFLQVILLEYSALVCSQSLNFDDAIYLLRERGKAMQTAVPLGQGSMIAVLGTQIDDVKNIIKETNFQKELVK